MNKMLVCPPRAALQIAVKFLLERNPWLCKEADWFVLMKSLQDSEGHHLIFLYAYYVLLLIPLVIHGNYTY